MTVADTQISPAAGPNPLSVCHLFIVPAGKPDHLQKQLRSELTGQVNQLSQDRRNYGRK
jgi:hypothetical protein